jgi:hypothetical protein
MVHRIDHGKELPRALVVPRRAKAMNSGDTLLIYGLWSRLFEFERSIEQPFQPFNEGIIANWPPGSLMLSE